MIPRRDFLANGLAAVSAQFLTQASAFAQSKYPERAIRLVVPFPPGGGYDAVARPWAERIKPLLGTVVIENMGGGGSSLGAAAAARARPDGYTLLLGGSSTHITEALLKNRPLYDPIKDLEPISNIALAAFAFAIHPSVPARSLSEFIARAKANPGKLSYGHPASARSIILPASFSSRWREFRISRKSPIAVLDRQPPMRSADRSPWSYPQ